MRRRNKLWLINALNYYFLKLSRKRDENLWLFGAWRGRKYDDNSKYLFEYVCEYCPNITAVWISNNEDVVNEVRRKGYEAEIGDSKKGRELQKKAGIVFYTNGIDDFGDVTYVYGAQAIALWHGTGFKKLYNANIEYGGLKLWAKHIKDSIFDFTYRDISISTSDLATKWIIECFNVPEEKIYVTGLPRNDAFKRIYNKSDVIYILDDPSDFRYILYMPTYRSYNEGIISNTIEGLVKDKSFNAFLRGNKIRLILKLHPLTNITIDDLPENYIVLKGEDISSVQELMAISDILITDYSSAIIDFAIQKKPTILYTPDYEDYCGRVGIGNEVFGIYKKYSQNSIDSLIEVIERASTTPEKVLDLTNRINQMYESPLIAGTCYSENVIRKLEHINSRVYICKK